MRSFEEINADISHALRMRNIEGLRSLATEMQILGTPQAAAVAFNALGSAAMNTGDYLQALEYYDRVLAMHEELGDPARIAGVTNNKGLVYELTGDYPQALEHYDRALALYEEEGDRVGVARVTGNLGNAYQYTGDYPQALEHFRRSLAMHEELGDRAGVATAVGNMGNVYARTGDHPQALEHYRRALALYEEMENRAGVANVTGNMGIVYESTSDYPSALEYFRRALTVHEELGDRASVARVTGNMGVVYRSTGDYPQALDHYRRALAAHEELGELANAARVTAGIGTVYKSTGDNPQALDYYRRALAMHEQVGDRAGIALATGNMIGTLLTLDRYDEAAELLDHQATLLLDAPDIRAQHQVHQAMLAEHHNDLEAAQRHFVEALAITATVGLRSLSAEVHKGLRDLAQKRNDFAGYIEYNNEYQRITEEIRGKEATQRMAMMEAERNAEAVERERQKERALLYGALPESVATRLLRGETVEDQFENASVLFADIVGFTTHTSALHPSETIKLLESLYKHFDALCAEHGATKVKTIGDSYLCFTHSLLSPDPSHLRERGDSTVIPSDSEERIAAVALAMQQAEFYWPSATANSNSNRILLRIGIHAGPVSAGVIGTERLQYDIWGDTVNTASRMESTGEPGRIQVSSAFAEQLRLLLAVAEKEGTANSNSQQQQKLTERGEVSVKGKGTMTTYWLEPAE